MEGLRIAVQGPGEMRAQTSVRIEKAALKLTQQQTVGGRHLTRQFYSNPCCD